MGVGGAGMSGLATLLKQLGANVSGCDLAATSYTDKLVENGIEVEIGHSPEHLGAHKADILVYSSAIPTDHPEILRAWQEGTVVARRAEILSVVFNELRGVGVAGTHGKTTTSSMISLIAERAGVSPTIAIGGQLPNIGTNAKLGDGEYMVAELDESDRSFVYFHPELAIVTNIDWDHRDHYMTFKSVTDAFYEFISNKKPSAKVIACMDDFGIQTLLREYKLSTEDFISYGKDLSYDWCAQDIKHKLGGGVSYKLLHKGKLTGEITLTVSGDHNVLNSVAACAAAYEMGLTFEDAKKALYEFSGANRRLQKTGEVEDILVYDDYGHHPNEIRATLATVRNIFPGRRVIAVFQPHRFSRTAALYKEFAEALSLADRAFILPVYPSDERPIEGVTSKLILDAASEETRDHYQLYENFEDLIESSCKIAEKHDIILTIGAGSVGTLSRKIYETLLKMYK